MAITDVRFRRSLQLSEAKDNSGAIKTTASLELLIVSDTKDPTFASILADTNTWVNLGNIKIPQLGDEVQVNQKLLVVTQRDLAFDGESDRVVVMTIKYSSRELDDEQDDPNNTDAESWKRITIQTQSLTEPAKGFTSDVAAKNPNAVQDFARNSAGDPVDGLEEETAMIRLTYTNTKVADPNFEKLNEYTNTCNDNNFLGGTFYTVRCIGWSGEYDQKNNCWQISLEFLYKPDDWSITFYDIGFNEIVDGERRAILDKAGNPVSSPVPLDGNGHAAAIGTSSGTGSEYQPVPLSFRYLYPYKAVNMANIIADCRI